MEGALFLFREKRKRKSFWISEDTDFSRNKNREKKQKNRTEQAVETR